MGELSIHRTNYLIEQNLLTQDLFSRWIAFIDASPKTVEAYTKGIKYFGEYLSVRGIRQPTRETVIAYRDELKKNQEEFLLQMCAGIFHCDRNNDERQIFELADKALYQAKNTGKSKVIVYGD